MPLHTVRVAAEKLNGISIAYMMGVSNAAFALVHAFGVQLTDEQIAAVTGLLNAVLIFSVHLSHRVGEATISGTATKRARLAEEQGG